MKDLSREVNGVVDFNGSVSIRPCELSTRIMFLRLGTEDDSMFPDERSGMIC